MSKHLKDIRDGVILEPLQEFPKSTRNLDFFGKWKNPLQQLPISTWENST
jgi:hypothetical protein